MRARAWMQVALRREASGQLAEALVETARSDMKLLLSLVWLLRSEGSEESERGVAGGGSAPGSAGLTSPAAPASKGLGGWGGIFSTSHSSSEGANSAGKGGKGAPDAIFRLRCDAMLAQVMERLSPRQQESILAQTTLVRGLVQTATWARLTAREEVREETASQDYLTDALRAVTSAASELTSLLPLFVPTGDPGAAILDVAPSRCKLLSQTPASASALALSSVGAATGAACGSDRMLLASFAVRRATHVDRGGEGEGGVLGVRSPGAAEAGQGLHIGMDRREEYVECVVVCDDCRADVLASQLLAAIKEAVHEQGLLLPLEPYHVLAVGRDRGLVQLPEALAHGRVMGVRQGEGPSGGRGRLLGHFLHTFGQQESSSFVGARTLFCESLAGCVLVTFLLHVRSRLPPVSSLGPGLVLGEDGRVHLFALNTLFDPPTAGDRNSLRLTWDMLDLLGALGGGGVVPLSSEPFKYFSSLLVLNPNPCPRLEAVDGIDPT